MNIGTTALSSSITVKLLRHIFFAILRRIKDGTLILCEGNETQTFGFGNPIVTVTVSSPTFYRRALFGGTVGIGEAYIDGDWDSDDLVKLVCLFLSNRNVVEGFEGIGSTTSAFLNGLVHRLKSNTLAGSRRNIRSHYDLSNDFFSRFLDTRLMYSAAVFETEHMSLEEASTRKLERICRKLELNSNDRLLEIGSGWGGFALYAAKQFGCKVTTITISQEQFEEASTRVREESLEDQVCVCLKDYREIQGSFDKVVSIEMVEAVGSTYLDTYFGVIDRVLRPGGLFLIQAITIQDQRYRKALQRVDFIKKHIFPGSFIPSVTALLGSVTKKTNCVLVNLEDFGFDYALTLANWRQSFETEIQNVMAMGFDREFIRMWRFYLSYCEGGFRERSLSDVQMLFVKHGYKNRPWRVQST